MILVALLTVQFPLVQALLAKIVAASLAARRRHGHSNRSSNRSRDLGAKAAPAEQPDSERSAKPEGDSDTSVFMSFNPAYVGNLSHVYRAVKATSSSANLKQSSRGDGGWAGRVPVATQMARK